MKPVHTFIAIAALATLAACGTVMPSPPSGFLSDYGALSGGADSPLASRASALVIDPAQVRFEAVTWRVTNPADISPDEREALLTTLHSELQQRVQALPAAPQGRAAVVRAAITRVETVSPLLNGVATLLLIGPLDRGGAAVEIEAVDAQTGQQLAALKLGYFAPLSDLKARFSKMAPAEISARKAATEFAALLQERAPIRKEAAAMLLQR